jgi:hypothetical protein
MKKIALIMILVVVSLSPSFAASKKKEICPSPVSMACMKKNFAALYQENNEVFFSAYRKHQDKALKCNDAKTTADYFALAPVIEMNAEVSEDFGEVSEKLITENPRCFLDAASLLDDQSLKSLINDYIKKPTFEDEKKNKKIMQKHRKNSKYARVMSVYFSK